MKIASALDKFALEVYTPHSFIFNWCMHSYVYTHSYTQTATYGWMDTHTQKHTQILYTYSHIYHTNVYTDMHTLNYSHLYVTNTHHMHSYTYPICIYTLVC